MPTSMGQKLSYSEEGPHFVVTRGGDHEINYIDQGDGFLLGKRYESKSTGITLLCTKPGMGKLLVGEEEMEMLTPKKLPSSD